MKTTTQRPRKSAARPQVVVRVVVDGVTYEEVIAGPLVALKGGK
jgi:hypothetical protein